MRRLAFVAVAAAGAACALGCGGGASDPASAQVRKFFDLCEVKSYTNAFPQCGSKNTPPTPDDMRSWANKFGGHVNGMVKETKFYDAEGNETASAADASTAVVRWDCYVGAISKGNNVVWIMPLTKETDSGGNEHWAIEFGPAKCE
jgi:hypothetical protein